MKSKKMILGLIWILIAQTLGLFSQVPKADCSGAPTTLWSKTFGGTGDDLARALVKTPDGGYILAGSTASFGPSGDGYLVKVDHNGNLQWNKTYGGSNFDEFEHIIQTSDGGYALAGVSGSYTPNGSWDFWLVKVDASGLFQWNKTYNSMSLYYDVAFSIVETSDGGYAMAGVAMLTTQDYWIVKTDSTGNAQWNKTYGGIGNDVAYSIIETDDGGYFVGGYGFASLVKIDSNGDLVWNKTYSGHPDVVLRSSDGTYVLVGSTEIIGSGVADVWLSKVDSSGNLQWEKTYGGSDDDAGWSAIQAYDGGYAVAGYTESFGSPSYWLVKADSAGNMQWNKTWVGAWSGYSTCSVEQASDGGYVLALATDDFGAGGYDAWLVKTGYGLDITVDEGGNTSPTLGFHAYATNSTVEVLAIPDEYYLFDHWELDGVVVGSTNPISVFMDSNHTLHAVFVTHNVAALNVASHKTIVGQGYGFNVSVTVANHGNVAESFSVDTYANSSVLETRNIQNLPARTNVTWQFAGSTAALDKGYYWVLSVSSSIPDEMNASDNVFVDGSIYVGVPGDVDGNHIVNMLDLYLIALNFGKSAPFATPQIANYDIDNNGIINMLDLYIAATHYGQTDP